MIAEFGQSIYQVFFQRTKDSLIRFSSKQACQDLRIDDLLGGFEP